MCSPTKLQQVFSLLKNIYMRLTQVKEEGIGLVYIIYKSYEGGRHEEDEEDN